MDRKLDIKPLPVKDRGLISTINRQFIIRTERRIIMLTCRKCRKEVGSIEFRECKICGNVFTVRNSPTGWRWCKECDEQSGNKFIFCKECEEEGVSRK